MRNRSEKVLLFLVALLALVAAGLIVVLCMFHVVDFKLYRKNQEVLDLRGKEISVLHYNKLAQLMPETEILWDIPFQGSILPHNAEEVTVTQLTEEDALALFHLKQLKKIHAEGCREYGLLLALDDQLPQAEVSFTVALGGQEYPSDAQTIELTAVTAEELPSLGYLRNLREVAVCGNPAQTDFSALQSYCRSAGLDFAVKLGETVIPEDAAQATAVGVQEDDLYLLTYLKQLTELLLQKPQAPAQALVAAKDANPAIALSWEVDFFGETVVNTEVPEELDLSKREITSLEELEASMTLLDGVKTVFLGECGIDNEVLAAYRDRVRDQYKVVWEVRFGNSKPLRTDADYFFPSRDGYTPEFNNDTADNLRYCEDLVSIDVGHLGIKDVGWLEGLPNLEYLILAHTAVQYIDGIENCKKLKFLELDWSGIRDLSPLVGCTSLEDLNIGNTWPDVTPLTQMPWLKNIYMIFGDRGDAWTLSQALPDTHVVVNGNATVGGNWRKLPNYYAMRDSLHAYYMNG